MKTDSQRGCRRSRATDVSADPLCANAAVAAPCDSPTFERKQRKQNRMRLARGERVKRVKRTKLSLVVTGRRRRSLLSVPRRSLGVVIELTRTCDNGWAWGDCDKQRVAIDGHPVSVAACKAWLVRAQPTQTRQTRAQCHENEDDQIADERMSPGIAIIKLQTPPRCRFIVGSSVVGLSVCKKSASSGHERERRGSVAMGAGDNHDYHDYHYTTTTNAHHLLFI